MEKDEGCPTCSSKNFGNLAMNKNEKGKVVWNKYCYNCKKSWSAET